MHGDVHGIGRERTIGIDGVSVGSIEHIGRINGNLFGSTGHEGIALVAGANETTSGGIGCGKGIESLKDNIFGIVVIEEEIVISLVGQTHGGLLLGQITHGLWCVTIIGMHTDTLCLGRTKVVIGYIIVLVPIVLPVNIVLGILLPIAVEGKVELKLDMWSVGIVIETEILLCA
jgi:hypothetical protein